MKGYTILCFASLTFLYGDNARLDQGLDEIVAAEASGTGAEDDVNFTEAASDAASANKDEFERGLKADITSHEQSAAVVNATAEGVPALVDQTRSLEWKTRLDALKALRDLGSSATQALPAITYCLADPDEDCRGMAMTVLNGLGRENADQRAMAGLSDLTRNADWKTRLRALRAFDFIGPAAWPQAQAIVERMDDGDEHVMQAANRVWRTRIDKRTPEEAVRSIAARTTRSDWKTRLRALAALVRLGENAKPAVSEATYRLVDTDKDCRKAARELVQNLGSVDHNAVRIIATNFLRRGPDRETRIRAIAALEWLSHNVDGGGSWAKPAMDDIIDAMADPDADIQAYARKALATIRRADETGRADEPGWWSRIKHGLSGGRKQ